MGSNNCYKYKIYRVKYFCVLKTTMSCLLILLKLTDLIHQSGYIFIPSRRVFKNQNNSSFPISQKYYQSLFSGDLGFSQIKIFSKSNSLFLNSENAEETFSVFDNPTIRIFKKNES